MKYIYLLIFITSFQLTHASDGEYRCDSVQNVSFRDLSNKVLSVSYHIDKVKELKSNGLRSSAIGISEEGLKMIERLRSNYQDEIFCYSLTKRVEYQKDLLTKYQIELTLLQDNLKKYSDCTYALIKLEKETHQASNITNSFYEKFIATSKALTKAQLVREDKGCDTVQQRQISTIINKQTTLLSSLYKKSTDS